MMGEILECEQEGMDVSYLKIRIPEDLFEAFSIDNAIVWTPERDQAFADCGLRDGPVRAFYPIPPTAWSQFLAAAADFVEEYTGEYPKY